MSPRPIRSCTLNSNVKQSNGTASKKLKVDSESFSEEEVSEDSYQCSSEDEEESSGDLSSESEIYNNPRRAKSNNTLKTPSKATDASHDPPETPSKSFSRLSIKCLTPSMHTRTVNISKPSTPLQEARSKLHVSAVPKSLPCREEQFNEIYKFLHGRLSDGSGGCIYVSGVPGTGKTATVNEVIRCLRKQVAKGELKEFQFVDINGMKLSEPKQSYVQIWKQIEGESKSWEESLRLLQKRFSKPTAKQGMTLMLVDELDLLCNKRQDVVYNLLDWPTKTNAKLVVVTIANTMDLPERILMGKVSSRMGLTRLTFPPYNHKQLEQIVISRLKGHDAFSGGSVELVARKVAAVSGDARRALDICRRATEVAERNERELVSMMDVKLALDEMIASPKIQAIRHCSEAEKMFLQAVCVEVNRTGVEEVIFKNVYYQMKPMCLMEGQEVPNSSEVLAICGRLVSYRLLTCDNPRRDILQKILLNVSTDDVHFALQNTKF
ncbi:hypothetical protein QAD02_019944 [Eretmocerus hayati]|uniref:Uncharacterized protein n=1 Tax=Eretmocerus hayati TaxID=131215 RepID=A0ACC2PL20_9HYME|nr:hypothetical protein QAD02_019944 [Eretmocerus hayati]